MPAEIIAGGLIAGALITSGESAFPGGYQTSPPPHCYHCQYGHAAPARVAPPVQNFGYAPYYGAYSHARYGVYAPGYTYRSQASLGGGGGWGWGSW